MYFSLANRLSSYFLNTFSIIFKYREKMEKIQYLKNQLMKIEINSQSIENIRYSCDNDFPMIKHPILGIIF